MNTGKIVLIMVVLSFSALFFYGSLFVDDSYITLRYASNLAKGCGLRFNPQDLEPLEGYTNFGWLLLQVPILLFTANPQIIFSLCSLLSFFMTLYILNSCLIVDNWRISPAVVVMLTFHSFWFWNIAGLETGMMGAYLLLWNIVFIRSILHSDSACLRRYLWPVVFLATVSLVTRPDCVIVVAVHALFLLFSRKIVLCFSYLAGIVVALFPYLLFKQVYFGFLLPNTFYAKTGLSTAVVRRGFRYVAGLGAFPELWVLFICFIVLSIIVIKNQQKIPMVGVQSLEGTSGLEPQAPARLSSNNISRISILPILKLTVLLVGSYLLYFLPIGGDYFPYYRFLYPLIPWIVFVCSHLFLVIGEKAQLTILAVFVLAFAMSTGVDSFEYALSFRTDNELSIVAAGHLKEHYPSGTVAVTAASGVVNYYCDFNSTDLYGLTDSRISRGQVALVSNSMAGHDKYDIELVRELEPELIIPHLWIWGETCPVDFRTSGKWLNSTSKTSDGVRVLLAAPFLKDRYVQKEVPLQVGENHFVYIFYERSRGTGRGSGSSGQGSGK